MASPPASPTAPTHTIGYPVSQQLSSVSAMLETTVQQMITDLVATGAALEAALAHLPDGPLHSEALQRALSHQTRLQESTRLTHAALQASKSEVQRLTLQLSSLGAAVAKQDDRLWCLDQLKIDMESVISEITSGGAANSDTLAEARDHMAKMLDGLTTISSSCRTASSGSSPPTPSPLHPQPGTTTCLRMMQASAAPQEAQHATVCAAAPAAERPAPMDLDTVSCGDVLLQARRPCTAGPCRMLPPSVGAGLSGPAGVRASSQTAGTQ